MRSVLLATIVALGAMAALPAAAQSVTGTVNVHGFVAPRCGATYAGDSTFTGSIQLGELTQASGTLSPTLENSTASSPAGSATFLIGCTGGGATVTLSASRLSNPTAPSLAGSSNDIDYTVQAKIAMAAGGFSTVNYTTADPAPSPTTSTIAGAFANAPGNFDIRIYGLSAENGASSFLVAGSYDSTITVLVSPAS